MKIRDLLNEGYCDLVAHYYPKFGIQSYDQTYNPDAEKFASIERKESKDKVNDNGVNIVTKAPEDEEKWTTEPDMSHQISPGARGKKIITRL